MTDFAKLAAKDCEKAQARIEGAESLLTAMCGGDMSTTYALVTIMAGRLRHQGRVLVPELIEAIDAGAAEAIAKFEAELDAKRKAEGPSFAEELAALVRKSIQRDKAAQAEREAEMPDGMGKVRAP